MKVIIIIPSCSSDRIPLLIQTVESIQAGEYKNVHPVIVADGNSRIFEEANKRLHNVTVIRNKERIDWVASTNRVLKEFDSDCYIYAADDLIFPSDCIENAVILMRKHFPDGYGVINLGRRYIAVFGLFGRKWVEHFPDRQVFCPDYTHYCSDLEHTQFVKKIEKLIIPPKRDIQVKHFRLNDETRRLARKVRNVDRRLMHKREEKNYLWGMDFNLIKK